MKSPTAAANPPAPVPVDRRITGVLLLGLALLAFVVRTERGQRDLSAGLEPGIRSRPVLLDADAADRARRVALTLAAGRVPVRDAFREHALLTEPPLFPLVLALAGQVGASTPDTVSGGALGGVDEIELEGLLWRTGPFLGALGVLAVYFGLRRPRPRPSTAGGGGGRSTRTAAWFGAATHALAPPLIASQAGGRLSPDMLAVPLLFLGLAGACAASRSRAPFDRLVAALVCGLATGLASLTSAHAVLPSLALLLGLAGRGFGRRTASSGAAWAAGFAWFLLANSMRLHGPWEALELDALRTDLDRASAILGGALAFFTLHAWGRPRLSIGVAFVAFAGLAASVALGLTPSPEPESWRAWIPWLGTLLAVGVGAGRSTGLAFVAAAFFALFAGGPPGAPIPADALALALPIAGAFLALVPFAPFALLLLLGAGGLSASHRASATRFGPQEVAFLRDLRHELPSAGPWNAARSTPDYRIACSVGLSGLVRYHARRAALDLGAEPGSASGAPVPRAPFLVLDRSEFERGGPGLEGFTLRPVGRHGGGRLVLLARR